MTNREQIMRAIAAQESLRGTVDDNIIDNTIALLKNQLADLDTSPPAEQQRKQVTILFADVVGSTSMSEHLDPEDVMEIMDSGLRLFGEAVQEHGGRVGRFMGDGMLALFGVHSAREDDPERAIRAGLAVQAAARIYEKQVKAQWGVERFAVRVGINTGLVMLGKMGIEGATDYTAIGDAVNLAARLESAAPVGGLLISHNTYQHVRGLFDVQALQPISVKGKTEHIRVYVVLRAKPRGFLKGKRGVEGIETRMIGREAELKHLQDAFYTAIEENEHQMITIVGEAGVGKSRLLYEFVNWAEMQLDRFHIFKGRASQAIQNMPFALIRDMFFSHLQIQDSDHLDFVRDKLVRGVERVLESGQNTMKAHFIGQLLCLDFSDSPHLKNVREDANQISDRALVYITDYFKSLSAQFPILILLEDLHWADDSSLELLIRLILALPGRPILIVGATRKSLFEHRPNWGEGLSFHHRLDLRLLSARDSGRLVKELLQKVAEIPEQLSKSVVKGAEGNPYYVEEMIMMLIEDGVIVVGEEEWRVKIERLIDLSVPPTLTGILQARLDRLQPEEKTILQQASVVGRRFWDTAVECISQSPNEHVGAEDLLAEKVETVKSVLAELRRKEMIFQRETSAFSGTKEFIFKHATLREVTYESVLKRVRQVYHGLVANWLIEQSGDRVRELTGLLADHLEMAGETKRAVRYLRRAGEQAAAQFANSESMNYFTRAIDLTPENEWETRYHLLWGLQRLFDLQGMRELQWQNLEMLTTLAEALDNVKYRAEVWVQRARYANAIGDYSEAIIASKKVISLAQSVDAVEMMVDAYDTWSWALYWRGQQDEARQQAEQGLTLARKYRYQQGEGRSLEILSTIARKYGDYAAAQRHAEQYLAITREMGNKRDESDALNSLNRIARDQGDLIRARNYSELALVIDREIGDKKGEGVNLTQIGNVLGYLGDYAMARTYLEQSLTISHEVNDLSSAIFNHSNLGFIALELGDYEAAERHSRLTWNIARQIGFREYEGVAQGGLGQRALQQGDFLQAETYLEQGVTISDETDKRYWLAVFMALLGHAQVGSGKIAEAASTYQSALDKLRTLGLHHLVPMALDGLARVALAEENVAAAMAHVTDILSYLEDSTLNGTIGPLQIYLTCYQVLKAGQDPRAGEILGTAYELLQARADKIPDEATRRMFLENIPWHREIVGEFGKIT